MISKIESVVLIRSLARVIKCTSCHVFWCDATSYYLCMSGFSHDLKDSALFGASPRRKFPEKQQINGFSKSVRLSEHCSQALDKQFPLFCFFIYFVSAAHSTLSHLKVLIPAKITKSEKTHVVVVHAFSQTWPILPSWQVHMTKPYGCYHNRHFPTGLILNTDSTGDRLDTRS